jgi:hypothetical protein
MQPLIRFRGVDHFYGDGSLRRQILYNISAEVRAVKIVLLTVSAQPDLGRRPQLPEHSSTYEELG